MEKHRHVIRLRHELHRNPELSGAEKETARRIRSFINRLNPDKVMDKIGGEGIAFIFNGEAEGETVLLRCELDALPIAEKNVFDHRSAVDNTAHLCGHDGHMAILAGVAEELSVRRPSTGRVILLFQPAEETGEGGSLVVNDPLFKEIQPDWVFALHNIPGYPQETVLVREGPFAAASVGMEVKLHGKTSHAGEPEKGINPAKAVAEIITGIINLPAQKHLFMDMVLATIVHINLGGIAYGTSAGYAELRATLRAFRDEDLVKLQDMSEKMIRNKAIEATLEYTMKFVEPFPAVNNHKDATQRIIEAARENNLPVVKLETPFRWSEDFSNIINKSKGAMFGLGAGENTPQLHNPDYDFPDEIIRSGIRMFTSIVNQILDSK
jgi:amidohydrolase